jgi:hypothetical protein
VRFSRASELRRIVFLKVAGGEGSRNQVLATIDAARGTIDALSLRLVLAFDNLLTDIRLRLRGEQNAYCTNDGPELRNGVTVDRALDAAGN